jgi:hypothetical protein
MPKREDEIRNAMSPPCAFVSGDYDDDGDVEEDEEEVKIAFRASITSNNNFS